MARVVMLGPIALPTLMGDIQETIGDQLETIGAGVVAGDRRPRTFPVTIPVHGDTTDGSNRFVMGNRLRRQVRALIENSQARLQGLYLAFSPDPEQNGWLLVGGGDLAYADGGIALADFKLELTDCYRIANQRTHRPARRVVASDRRLNTTARDILEILYSSDFSGTTPIARHYLPAGITDPVIGATRSPLAVTALATTDGSLSYAEGLTDGNVVDFEQGETDIPRAGVRILDRQNQPATEALWEQVYGPDQPLTAGDIPVIDNGLVRCVFTFATGLFDVQTWTGSAWAMVATVAPLVTGFATVRARVVEWTPERAVIAVTGTSSSGTLRHEIFITLQRGWTGPRVECYSDIAGGSTTAQFTVYSKSTGTSTVQRSSGTTTITSGGAVGTFSGLQPWALLLGPGTDGAIWLAAVQAAALTLTGAIMNSRGGVTASAADYASLWLGIGPRASGVADATAHGQRGLIDSRVVPELVAR